MKLRDGLFFALTLPALQAPLPALAVEGAAYSVDARFDRSTGSPQGGLVRGADGFFYGVALTRFDSASDGTIYRSAAGGAPMVVHRFVPYGPQGNRYAGEPSGSLIRLPDDSLWGVTTHGGDFSVGTVYRFDPATGSEEIVHSFDFWEGALPYGRLLLASDGFVYGTASEYGRYDGGSIFRIDPVTRSFEVVWSFGAPGKEADGVSPIAGLTESPNLRLYGVTAYGTGTSGSLFGFIPYERRMSLVKRFPSSAGDLNVELTISPKGLIYGVTPGDFESTCGTVFSVKPDGKQFRSRHVFDCVHGERPSGALLSASDGFLYGAVWQGGPTYRLRPDTGAPEFSILKPSNLRHEPTAFGNLLEADGALLGVLQPLDNDDGGFLYDLRPEGR